MKQTDWKIIYSSYTGIAKGALRLLSKEISKYVVREEGIYRLYVLPCEKEGCEVSKNAFILGLYQDSELIRSLVDESEIKEGGFLVKVIENPADPMGRLVILTARDEKELLYSVVSFIDDYLPGNGAPRNGCIFMPDRAFEERLKLYSYTAAPEHPVRSIFTWGHSINDYRAYLDNMVRMGYNELILWNDYVPVNIDEVIDYAHSYGISIILGYTWGWKSFRKAEKLEDEQIEALKVSIVKEFEECYAPINCDGIYFQSFTERNTEYIGDKLVARVVTDMVNEITEKLLEIKPGMRIIFGLHATSVVNRLDEIARVDERVEILWEDCGDFPYDYESRIWNQEKYDESFDFTKKLLELRGGKGVGIVFKGVMMMDWSKFVYQRGPYVLGESAKSLIEHDKRIREAAWRRYSAEWMQFGEAAGRMMKFINDNELTPTTMCLAGTFDGGAWLPVAVCGQMFRGYDGDYLPLLNRVARRSYISLG